MSNGVLPALSDNHFGITFMYKARPPKGAGIVNETKINIADTCWPCSTGRWTWSRGRSQRGSSACKDCNITKCKQDPIQPVVKRFSSEKSPKLIAFPTLSWWPWWWGLYKSRVVFEQGRMPPLWQLVGTPVKSLINLRGRCSHYL